MVDLNQHRKCFEKGIEALYDKWGEMTDQESPAELEDLLVDLFNEIDHFLSGYMDEGN